MLGDGDMVTLVPLQGIRNTCVIFFVCAIGAVVDSALGTRHRTSGGSGVVYPVIVVALECVLGLLATANLMAFARRREFRAFAAAADLAGPENMNASLRILQQQEFAALLPGQLCAFGIRGVVHRRGMRRFMMSHQPIEDRIAKLQSLPTNL